MKNIMGIEYGRGATAVIIMNGPASAPTAVKAMYPNANWTIVSADPYDAELWQNDRFGENFQMQKKIFAATPYEKHIMIGGDHSVNFGHFAALADRLPDEDLCLIYIDAHLDIHTPESSKAEASGAPHGANVRALLGDGDSRWLSLQTRRPALYPENLFYIGVRSYEPAEINFVNNKKIYTKSALDIQSKDALIKTADEIKRKIGNKKYVVSFDFDSLDPKIFKDVLVPEPNGISLESAEYLIKTFAPNAYSFEFVEYSPNGDKQSANIVKHLVGIVLGKE